MKTFVVTFFFCLTLFGCNSRPDKESLKGDLKTEQVDGIGDTITTYWQPDHDTRKSALTVPIGNDSYLLKSATYSLNDSSITWINDLNKDKIYKDIYHNYQSSIQLVHQNDTVLDITLDKETFKDSLSSEFYERSVIWNIEYQAIRSNRLFFTVDFLVPDTDWMMTAEMAVFYRTPKKGQIDFWSLKEK